MTRHARKPEFTAESAARLAHLEAAFAEAGGRGPDMAEEIDALRRWRDGKFNPGEVYDLLVDPDMVGTTSYRAVHETVTDAVAGQADEDPEADALGMAIGEAESCLEAAQMILDALNGTQDREQIARRIVAGNEHLQAVFVAELANEDAMRREAMSKQREDEIPPAANLSTVIDSVRQGLPIAVDCDSEAEIGTLVDLLAVRDLLPGAYEVRNLLPD